MCIRDSVKSHHYIISFDPRDGTDNGLTVDRAQELGEMCIRDRYIGGKVEVFALQSGDETELKVLVMAINDQMGPDAEYFDFTYYQSIITETKD